MADRTSSTRKLWGWVQDWARRLGRTPKIGVALGAGASRGVAHIGVLSVFKELDIPISYLSGCSAGSLVGALYASGLEGERLERCGREYDWRDAGRLNLVPKMGLAANTRMASYLKKQIGDPNFEDLRLPLFVVTTNLSSGQRQVFSEGPVISAVRASCAIPGIFDPVEIGGELYCDGGLLDRVPCEVLRQAGADLVVCVDLTPCRRQKRPADIFEVINRSIDIALSGQSRIGHHVDDLIIRPEVDNLHVFDFDQGGQLIERGKEAALAQLTPWLEKQTSMEKMRAEATS